MSEAKRLWNIVRRWLAPNRFTIDHNNFSGMSNAGFWPFLAIHDSSFFNLVEPCLREMGSTCIRLSNGITHSGCEEFRCEKELYLRSMRK